MKFLLTLAFLALPHFTFAANMAEKIVTSSDTFDAEEELAKLFNEAANQAGSPIAKKMAALRAQYEGSTINPVEPVDVWRLSGGRSGRFSGSTYVIAVWEGYKSSSSHVAYAIAHTHFDELDDEHVTIQIEKFVNNIKLGDY